MQSFTTLFEAILAAEDILKSAVMISDASGNTITFSRLDTQDHYSCTINDGYDRFMQDGKVKMVKQTVAG